MLDYLHRHILPATYALLPSAMASQEATAMLLAIALQESQARFRRQIGGPARGFWQFELAGALGVRHHSRTRDSYDALLTSLSYDPRRPSSEIILAVEHNDVLAAGLARLLLWSLPLRLPDATEEDLAWDQYLEAWRPGLPHPETWGNNFIRAWAAVRAEGDE